MATHYAMDVDTAGLDLEAYIASYSGHAKVERLKFIARQAAGRPLELEALKLAAIVLKAHSENAREYQAVMDLIDGRLGPGFVADQAWIDAVRLLAAVRGCGALKAACARA